MHRCWFGPYHLALRAGLIPALNHRFLGPSADAAVGRCQPEQFLARHRGIPDVQIASRPKPSRTSAENLVFEDERDPTRSRPVVRTSSQCGGPGRATARIVVAIAAMPDENSAHLSPREQRVSNSICQ